MRPRVRISTVVGGYSLVASAWIVISDRLVHGELAGGTDSSLWWDTAKGLGFVAVTSAALCLLMRWFVGAIRKAEADRFDSDHRLALLFEGVRDQAIFLVDQDGRIVKANRASGALFARRPEESVGQHLSELLDRGERDGDASDGFLVDVVRNGRIDRQCWLHRADRSRFWAEVAIIRLDGAAGGASGFAVIARDETARLRAEEILQASEERLRESERRSRLMMDSSVDGLITICEDGVIESFSGAAARIFGYEPDEVIGKNIGVLMPEPDRSQHDGYLERYRLTGERRTIGLGREVQGLHADGRVFPMDLAVSEVVFGSGQRRFVGTVRDLSERKEFERQLRHAQKMEAVGQLTGGIAHDFNNLLSVTLGCAELLQDMFQHDERAAKLSATIAEAGKRGADLTRRLLAFSRQRTLEAEQIDLGQLLRGLKNLLVRAIGEEIDLKLVIPPDLPKAVADPTQLENALLNLAINARDAMPGAGQLTIAVDRAQIDEGGSGSNPDIAAGDYLVISVCDTGVGMPEEVRERAFDPFFTTKPIGQGTGLGLSMVCGFARQSGGQVDIRSEVGAGTTVRLYLPQSQRAARPAPAVGRERTELPSGSENILVVEDDPLVREYVTDRLLDLGYAVVAVADGPAALAEIESGRPFDMLFTDIVMPGGMNGHELAAEAVRRRPGLKLLFTTGHAADVMVLQGKLAADAPLLSKPYGRSTLARKLRAVIDNRAA